jgi:hypothetical protein
LDAGRFLSAAEQFTRDWPRQQRGRASSSGGSAPRAPPGRERAQEMSVFVSNAPIFGWTAPWSGSTASASGMHGGCARPLRALGKCKLPGPARRATRQQWAASSAAGRHPEHLKNVAFSLKSDISLLGACGRRCFGGSADRRGRRRPAPAPPGRLNVCCDLGKKVARLVALGFGGLYPHPGALAVGVQAPLQRSSLGSLQAAPQDLHRPASILARPQVCLDRRLARSAFGEQGSRTAAGSRTPRTCRRPE